MPARRPSPAMIVALIALVCALTGTAWAALGKNSVGSKQLKKNAVVTAKIKKEAVTGGKVKKDTLGGTQINEGKLGTVPSAGVASSLTPPEAVHLVGTAGQPTFENGSSNGVLEGLVGAHLNPVGFWKDKEGVVHLQGIAQVGKVGTSIVPIFTLPAGFRPAPGALMILAPAGPENAAILGGSNTSIEGLDLSGKVAGSKEKLSVLDGITFRAES
jgi:hypothetical protein